jgi:precorrin-8X/cobalt-precorrin-8 methylmutase
LSDVISDPSKIERMSFEIISSLVVRGDYSEDEFEVVKRVVHATADTEFAGHMVFSGGAVEAGVRAIRSGCRIITDVKMLKAGISPNRPGGSKEPYCFISDSDVTDTARREGCTRAAAAMRKAAPMMYGSIVAVGNAPTALYELMDILDGGAARPGLVVGVPVGFVGASESKDELERRLTDVPYITCRGRKGGSPVGAAIINALIRLAAGN